jgi:hypothetical protein
MLGSLQLAKHEGEMALQSLREAVQLREGAGAQSWELAHARELLGEALEGSGQVAAGQSMLQQALAYLQTQLGPNHPETLRVIQETRTISR